MLGFIIGLNIADNSCASGQALPFALNAKNKT
jgi:hypothetical protein